jgi:anti-sigma factor RsiW
MRCSDCREALTSYLDDELMTAEASEVREHLATCAECDREHRALVGTSLLLREKLVHHPAPDVLKARIRSAIAQPHAFESPRASRPIPVGRPRWLLFAAAGLVIAVASSALTFVATRQGASHTAASDVLASHIRSLMPDHLTDIVSTNQHNVKPWFNGRIGLSPPVPNLDSAGFVLVGGRLDYVEGRSVAAVVYSRRQHVINVYAWPTTESPTTATRETSDRGYHLVQWRADGVEYWVVSDLNRAELDQFVKDFIAAAR